MRPQRTLVLGMGNPILSDDSVGVVVAREVQKHLAATDIVDIAELYAGGIRLIDALRDYDRALIVDAIVTGRKKHGTIQRFDIKDFAHSRTTLCVHDMDLSTAYQLGVLTGVKMPEKVTIWGIEVKDVENFSEELTPDVGRAVPQVVKEVLEEIRK